MRVGAACELLNFRSSMPKIIQQNRWLKSDTAMRSMNILIFSSKFLDKEGE